MIEEIKQHSVEHDRKTLDVTYLGLDPLAYDNENPMYEVQERPLQRIAVLNSEARQRMTENVDYFRNAIHHADIHTDIAVEMKKIIRDLRITQTRKLTVSENDPPDKRLKQEKKRFASLKFLYNLGRNGGLFEHLNEAKQTTSYFFEHIKNHLHSDSLGDLITPRQVLLMEFVAATHDLPKLLGDLDAQIEGDHELIYQHILSDNLVGHFFMAANGEKITFTKEDEKFVIGVVGFHEDIWREKAFGSQVEALNTPLSEEHDQQLEQQIKRARMLFHSIDIFGNALEFDDTGMLTITDKSAFESRFIDLFRRHLAMPIKVEGGLPKQNWTRGKVFRPQWGLEGVAGLTWTFAALQKGWGISVSPGLIANVQQGIMGVLTEAEYAAQSALLEDNSDGYTLVNVNKLPEVKAKLAEIQKVKAALSTEISQWQVAA